MIGSLAVIICLVSFSSSKPRTEQIDGTRLPLTLEQLDSKMKIFADKLNTKLSKHEVYSDTNNSIVYK